MAAVEYLVEGVDKKLLLPRDLHISHRGRRFGVAFFENFDPGDDGLHLSRLENLADLPPLDARLEEDEAELLQLRVLLKRLDLRGALHELRACQGLRRRRHFESAGHCRRAV